ncbi:hypothetical protein DUNSADRAFT_7053 [Dunaliella salina]|uniref:Uncharacterized protein n=1 Tax=Dunaliella salina TaxID=3046 RepID=A0ABQ7H6G2_DUNSA|nr:hypothetical protein DUNSADRAFT_7053 [Dunaliella salina]|eukprot:KAF5842444.1 hypothetical protein DUNSADRAFT_7053 [Dunaliella salina]
MKGSNWTFADSKALEVSLTAHYSKPDRWEHVQTCLPDKSFEDMEAYLHQLEDDIKSIEDGTTPLPPYAPLPHPPQSIKDESAAAQRLLPAPKKSKTDCTGGSSSAAAAAAAAADRKKGVPWTEEEHKLFLQGLTKFGKGDWRNIARTFVMTRTPTQVASHAQKYFIRLNSQNNKKDKRRASIHDITH